MLFRAKRGTLVFALRWHSGYTGSKTKVPRSARDDDPNVPPVLRNRALGEDLCYRPAANRVASRGGNPAANMRSCAAFRLYGVR